MRRAQAGGASARGRPERQQSLYRRRPPATMLMNPQRQPPGDRAGKAATVYACSLYRPRVEVPMSKPTHFVVTIAAAAAMLAGCASAPAPAPSAAVDKPNETGTTLPVSTHGRMLKYIGNQGYRDDTQIRSLGNDIGAKSN